MFRGPFNMKIHQSTFKVPSNTFSIIKWVRESKKERKEKRKKRKRKKGKKKKKII